MMGPEHSICVERASDRLGIGVARPSKTHACQRCPSCRLISSPWQKMRDLGLEPHTRRPHLPLAGAAIRAAMMLPKKGVS